VDFVAANCRFMKMIKLRGALHEMAPEVKVPEAIAQRACLPIERMVAIG
jgi:quinolinate synthase